MIISYSLLLYIFIAKREPPTFRCKTILEVLSQHPVKVKFMSGKGMTVSGFTIGHHWPLQIK